MLRTGCSMQSGAGVDLENLEIEADWKIGANRKRCEGVRGAWRIRKALGSWFSGRPGGEESENEKRVYPNKTANVERVLDSNVGLECRTWVSNLSVELKNCVAFESGSRRSGKLWEAAIRSNWSEFAAKVNKLKKVARRWSTVKRGELWKGFDEVWQDSMELWARKYFCWFLLILRSFLLFLADSRRWDGGLRMRTGSLSLSEDSTH